MSSGVDLSQFYDTFFDEADELLAEMERFLLELDVDNPDGDMLNAIFRAAHSIKGGAATFGTFSHLADTTHLLENLLDFIRDGDMSLNQSLIDLFLESKDILSDQVLAYRNQVDPDQEVFERICSQLSAITEAHLSGEDVNKVSEDVVANAPPDSFAPTVNEKSGSAGLCVTIRKATEGEKTSLREEMSVMGVIKNERTVGEDFSIWLDTEVEPDVIKSVCGFITHEEKIVVAVGEQEKETEKSKNNLPLHLTIKGSEKEIAVLREEMALMGQVVHEEVKSGTLDLWLVTDVSKEDIQAVCCFVVNEDQILIAYAPSPIAHTTELAIEKKPSINKAIEDKEKVPTKKVAKPTSAGRAESTTLRVDVEKIDQIINLVGELVITQAMLTQVTGELDPAEHERLLSGVEQLERNARDLQESVMSIRMMPMDYVFSRFPRVVRENSAALNKEIKLVTKGAATELDKSLIERIIDPLTHLVRNSIDHGIEMPEKREAAGKPREGTLTLSAQHQGGHIVIEIKDDGGGLNREKVLKKAIASGLTANENIPDEELWQLLFAPGFSTAEEVTAISGRGVGMDVVRRNIQNMGGNVQMTSVAGQGTTTRIILPLTLAILDGMSVRVGAETFILPLSHVTESMQPTEEQMKNVTVNDRVMFVRGEYLPVVSLGEVFCVEGYQSDLNKAIAVVLQAEDARFALIVDSLIGQHQVVVKNLEANYRKVEGISAATILGDGSVALIVDVFAMGRTTRDSRV